MSHDEALGTYTVKVDPRLRYGFRDYLVSEEELNEILRWQDSTGIQVLYPVVMRNDYTYEENSHTDVNYWYKVSADGIPLDVNDQIIPYSENMTLVPNYKLDKEGNICYQLQMGVLSVATYKIRVLLFNYYQFRCGKELTYPFDQDECLFLRIHYTK